MSNRERGDVLSMVLVRWRFSELLKYMIYIVALLNQRERVHFEEIRFADEAELECGEGRTISFRCYCNEVVEAARRAQEREDPGEREYSVMMMRSCFLIALLYDTRVQRFVMAPHDIHYQVMRCEPPGRNRANLFMERIMMGVNDFLNRTISIGAMCTYCVGVWEGEFMFRRVGIEEDECDYYARSAKNIPHIDHPHKLSTVGHKDSYPSLENEYGF
jgi:hypothetical protein